MLPCLVVVLSLAQPQQHVKTPLWRDTVPVHIQYERQPLIDPYQSIGSKSPKWDKKALEFLEGFAKLAADDPSRDAQEVAAMCKHVTSLGCTDPAILALNASIAAGDSSNATSVNQLRSCAEALDASGYPAVRKAVAWSRLGQITATVRGVDAARPAYSKFIDHLIVACSAQDQPKIPPRHARSKVETLLTRDLPTDMLLDLCKRMEAAKADAWLVHMFWAEHYHRLAWAARGTGYASTVTAEGWKEFAANSEKLRDHLEAAYALKPEYPEPCYGMMVVVRTGHAKPGQTLRTWFDRGTAAQFDHIGLYDLMIQSLLPRWSGTHAKIEAFGRECAATGRYDTRVPYQYIQALLAIADDTRDYTTTFRRPGTYAKCREVLEAYIKAEPKYSDWYRSLLLGIAWRAGKFEDLRPLLTDAKGELDSDALGTVRVADYNISAAATLYGGPTADLFKQADAAHDKGHWTRARELCEEALAKCPESDLILKFETTNRVFLARFAESFESGKPTDLRFETNNPGWLPLFGVWERVSDTAMRARPHPEGLRMNFNYPVGLRFHLTGRLDFSAVSDPSIANAGIAFGFENITNVNPRYIGMLIFTGSNSIGLAPGWPTAGDKKAPEFNGPVDFEVTCFDDSVTIRVNGSQVYRGPLPKRSSWQPGDGFALGGRSNRFNGGIEYSNLRIRKLTENPDDQPDGRPKF
jgi:hypothetical protein